MLLLALILCTTAFGQQRDPLTFLCDCPDPVAQQYATALRDLLPNQFMPGWTIDVISVDPSVRGQLIFFLSGSAGA